MSFSSLDASRYFPNAFLVAQPEQLEDRLIIHISYPSAGQPRGPYDFVEDPVIHAKFNDLEEMQRQVKAEIEERQPFGDVTLMPAKAGMSVTGSGSSSSPSAVARHMPP